jgi:hypothetical protein
MKQKTPCPRCGMMLWAGQLPQHMPTCERLPLPADLRREFEASGMSVHAFALSYGFNSGGVIRKRLLLSGLTLDDMAAIGRQISRSAHREFVTCKRCGRRVGAKQTAVHRHACDAHPPGVELVAEWRKSGLRVEPFCNVKGYQQHHVTGVLDAAGVTKAERDAGKTAHSLERVERCKRCDYPANRARMFEGICQYCVAEGARRYGLPVPAAALAAVGMR